MAKAHSYESLEETKVVLFDFDNTLQHGDKLELHARLGAVANRLALDYTPEDIEIFGDRSDYREMRQLMVSTHKDQHPETVVTEELFQKENMAISGSFDHHFYLADFAEELLDGIRVQAKKLGLVTTRGSNSITRLLTMHNILDYFDVVVNRDACPERKPHPAPIKLALLQLGIDDPSQATYVGDKQEDDVQGGKNAGTLTVLINKNLDPSSTQPDFHFTSLEPLAELYKPK